MSKYWGKNVLPFKTSGSHFYTLLCIYSLSISWHSERVNGVTVLWSVFCRKSYWIPSNVGESSFQRGLRRHWDEVHRGECGKWSRRGVRMRTAAKRSLNVVLTGAKSLSSRSTLVSDIAGKILVLVPFLRVDQWCFEDELCIGSRSMVLRAHALQKIENMLIIKSTSLLFMFNILVKY